MGGYHSSLLSTHSVSAFEPEAKSLDRLTSQIIELDKTQTLTPSQVLSVREAYKAKSALDGSFPEIQNVIDAIKAERKK